MRLKDGLVAGLVGGTLWGILSMAVNGMTGIFPFEHPFFYNLVMFATGGALFGIVTGALFVASRAVLPLDSAILRATIVSVFVWMVLRGGGLVLSYMNPYRYHAVFVEALQGLALSVFLGIIVGMAVRFKERSVITT